MLFLHEDSEWKARWEQRGKAVHRVLGETVDPGMVTPFSWKDYILPGACAMTYAPSAARSCYLYMTLGLTQPLEATEAAYPWEFAIRATEKADWPIDLLYQLVTQWLCQNGDMWFGGSLPLLFFKDGSGQLWGGLSDKVEELGAIGSIRWLYLWTDIEHLEFRIDSQQFSLLTAVAVTEDERQLAGETSHAHLMLLLRRMAVGQICDPYRESVMKLAGAQEEWEQIRILDYDDVLAEVR